MKRAVFIISVLLVITLLHKMKLLSEFIFSALIGLGFAILFIYIIISLWDMSRRDRRYYDEYLFLSFQGKSGTGDDGKCKSSSSSTTRYSIILFYYKKSIFNIIIYYFIILSKHII